MSRSSLIRQLAHESLARYPAEAAEQLERLRDADVTEVLEHHDAGVAANVIRRLAPDRAAEVVALMRPATASAVLSSLEPAQAASLLSRLDDDARATRLGTLEAGLARELTDLMAYPVGVAGHIMDPRATTFRGTTVAREALTRLRALKNREIHDVFVIDDEGRLAGSVSVQDLALADSSALLSDLSRPDPPRVDALSPQDELVALAEDRRVSSVPVVDFEGRLVGVIRHNDLLVATQRDATADLQTMVGASKDERALSTVAFAVRKRLPWLQINLATAFLAAAVVGLFEGTIAQFTALAVLLPVVAGQSGNAGAQALAVTMRGLALREISPRHWFRVGRKELMVGAANGIAVALVTSLGVLVWSGSGGLAVVIGTSMVFSMVMAGVSGASVPMLLIALRQDPAAASSIVLTTITDVLGFLSFLGFATLAAGML